MRTKGFTLIETLIVLVMLGIFLAIAWPTYQGFVERQRLYYDSEQAVQVIKQGQRYAQRTKYGTDCQFTSLGRGFQVQCSRGKSKTPVSSYDGASRLFYIDTCAEDAASPVEWESQGQAIPFIEFNFRGFVARTNRVCLGKRAANRYRIIQVKTLIGEVESYWAN